MNLFQFLLQVLILPKEKRIVDVCLLYLVFIKFVVQTTHKPRMEPQNIEYGFVNIELTTSKICGSLFRILRF